MAWTEVLAWTISQGWRRALPGMEYLEKSGRVWEKETVLPPLGLDMPLVTGEEDTFPLMVA